MRHVFFTSFVFLVEISIFCRRNEIRYIHQNIKDYGGVIIIYLCPTSSQCDDVCNKKNNILQLFLPSFQKKTSFLIPVLLSVGWLSIWSTSTFLLEFMKLDNTSLQSWGRDKRVRLLIFFDSKLESIAPLWKCDWNIYEIRVWDRKGKRLYLEI